MTESDNRVEARINPNVQGLRPSATVAINDRSNELRRQGREIFKLGLGQSPFPVPDPSRIQTALKERENPIGGAHAVLVIGGSALSDCRAMPVTEPQPYLIGIYRELSDVGFRFAFVVEDHFEATMASLFREPYPPYLFAYE